ncbi:MAG: hypothetical protein OMM_04771 [Candidatus Magnetoglobus multicellularis str. Araruama]|uniref:Lcl C-terminal domain-containing protein n=1 Tax=Candidatus Magnetoglobus multicellularis str. Araruama TaxID=890399 RepID=A0A1V1NZT6_9BACT|nr:MAG: hypothetical protein OMM_04771 [Candidatus Magnetoglobus multicellularis str. Araruama]
MKKQILMTILMAIVLSLTQINQSHAWPIPDTGQTQCYDNENEIPCPQPGEPFYGQDGNYLINEPSYTKLDAQGNDLPDDAYDWVMVRDNVTGLIWEIKTARNNVADYSNPNDADNRYTWYDSNPNTNGGYAGYYNDGQNTERYIQTLNSQQLGGFSDWRMPSLQELLSIVKASAYNPAIDTSFFMNTISDGFYWSSTSNVNELDHGRGVSFRYGYSQHSYKSNTYYVRAVRGYIYNTLEHWINNGDGTVTDTVTGLMWQQSTTEKSWSEALTFCKQLNLASYSDWRLPDKNELLSIVDFSKYHPSFETNIFDVPNSQWNMYFWSSTTLTYDLYHTFIFDFLYGSESGSYKSNQYNVRSVRGGQSYISEALFITSPAQASNWKIGSIMPIQMGYKKLFQAMSQSAFPEKVANQEPLKQLFLPQKTMAHLIGQSPAPSQLTVC